MSSELESLKQRITELEAKNDKLEARSEEHTSELQSPCNLVCRLLLEKKKLSAAHAPAPHRATLRRPRRLRFSAARACLAQQHPPPADMSPVRTLPRRRHNLPHQCLHH